MTYKSGVLFLTLDKAVKVAVNQFDVDPVIARQEFEQKCYVPSPDYEKGFYDGLTESKDIIKYAIENGFQRAMEKQPKEIQMTNYEVIRTMTAKELANWLKGWMADEWGDEEDIEKWLRSDSQDGWGLLTDSMKKYWKVH